MTDYIPPKPAMPHEPSNWNDGTLQLVGGYLRPKEFARDDYAGEVITLATESTAYSAKPRCSSYQGTSLKSDEEMKALFRTACVAETKRRKRVLKKSQPIPKPALNPDPQDWVQTPWRSAHDGMNSSAMSKWKWNEQKPMEEMRQYTMYNKHLRRNKSHNAMQSTYQAEYKHLGRYKPQTPSNLFPVPNIPLWQRHEPTLTQQRYYKKGQYRSQPEMTTMEWAHLKFRNNGLGASM